jgi:hypothetical protein
MFLIGHRQIHTIGDPFLSRLLSPRAGRSNRDEAGADGSAGRRLVNRGFLYSAQRFCPNPCDVLGANDVRVF